MSDNKNFQIRHALISRQEIAQIVKIHRSELSGGFLSSLGDTGFPVYFLNMLLIATRLYFSCPERNQ